MSIKVFRQKPHVFKRFSFQFRGFDRTTRTTPGSAREATDSRTDIPNRCRTIRLQTKQGNVRRTLIRVRFFGKILKRICDLRSFGSWCIKGTDESLSRVDSSVPLMHHDPNDLRSQIRFRILPKKRTLNLSHVC